MIKFTFIIATVLIFTSCNETSSLYNLKLKKRGTYHSVNLRPVIFNEQWILSDVVIVTDENDTIQGRLRSPVNHDRLYPLTFLVVGIETGKEVVSMIKGYDSVAVFSLDYPYRGTMDFSGWKGLTTTLALRTVGFKSIKNIFISLDYLSSLSFIDMKNISIIAVSFGVFTGVPSAVIDERVDRLVVVQAGGDLRKILSANAERLQMPVPSWLAGWLGSIILAPFEPNLYIDKFSPRPFLIVSGESDQLFPPESIESLFIHARDPKEWIKHKSGHVDPSTEKLIMELAEIVGGKLFGS